MKQQLILIVIAIICGALLPIQAGLNAQLGKAMGQPIVAAFISCVISAVGILVYLLFIKVDLSAMAHVKSVSPLVWTAGLMGAFFVAATIILTPKLGAALTFSLIVAGQMVISLILDHFGLLELPIKHINWQRVLGVILLVAGVLLIRRF